VPESIGVANKNEYLGRLATAIYARHRANAIHLSTERIAATTSRGGTIWEGEVEVFSITGHPEAVLCYAWTYQDGPLEHIAVILNKAPVRSALDAVRAFVATQVKKQQAN